MTHQDRFRDSDLGRAKPKRSFLHRLTNVSLKRHRSDTGLVEDRTSSVTIVRIIVGLLMIHLIIIGGVLLRGQMVKDAATGSGAASAATPPPSPLAPPPSVAAQDALPQPGAAHAAHPRPITANHITQAAPEDEEVAVEVEEVEPVLVSPGTPARQAAPAEPLRHLVAQGDTIYRIANQYGITEAALKAANPSLNRGVLRAGATLIIPAAGQQAGAATHPQTTAEPAHPAAPAGGAKTYTVQRGDTLTTISRKTGVSTKDIIKINGIKNPKRITPGMELRLSR